MIKHRAVLIFSLVECSAVKQQMICLVQFLLHHTNLTQMGGEILLEASDEKQIEIFNNCIQAYFQMVIANICFCESGAPAI